MKINMVSLRKLIYFSFILSLLVSVWTTPAFAMIESDTVATSSNELEAEFCNSFDGGQFLRKGDLAETTLSLYSTYEPIIECPSSFEQQVIFFINNERNLVGLPSLELDVRLETAARWMSEDMAAVNEVPSDHIDSLGRTFDVRISEESAYPYIHLGEVIAGGFSSPREVVNAWMNSPGHKARLLDEDYKHIGIGYSYNSNTDHWFYWTVDLGSTTEPRQPPLLDCDPIFCHLFISHIEK